MWHNTKLVNEKFDTFVFICSVEIEITHIPSKKWNQPETELLTYISFTSHASLCPMRPHISSARTHTTPTRSPKLRQHSSSNSSLRSDFSESQRTNEQEKGGEIRWWWWWKKILHTLHFRRPFCRPSMYIHPYFSRPIYAISFLLNKLDRSIRF